MRIVEKARAYARAAARLRERRRLDLLALLWRRPALLVGVATFETAVFVSGRVDSRLKYLASLKTGSLVGCPF